MRALGAIVFIVMLLGWLVLLSLERTRFSRIVAAWQDDVLYTLGVLRRRRRARR